MKLLTHEISTPWGKIASVVDVTNTPTVIGAGFKPIAKLIKQLPEKYKEFDIKKDQVRGARRGNARPVLGAGIVHAE